MTTFTTEDREALEKGLEFFAQLRESAPPHIVNSGASVQTKDVEFPAFNFRFVKQSDEWVCKMPDWLLNEAISVAEETKNILKNVQE